MMFVVVQLLWPTRTPDLSPIEHVWDMMKRELTLSPQPATTIAEFRQRVQDALDNLAQDDIRHLYFFMRKARLCCRQCIDVNVWAPITVTCVSFGLNL